MDIRNILCDFLGDRWERAGTLEDVSVAPTPFSTRRCSPGAIDAVTQRLSDCLLCDRFFPPPPHADERAKSLDIRRDAATNGRWRYPGVRYIRFLPHLARNS